MALSGLTMIALLLSRVNRFASKQEKVVLPEPGLPHMAMILLMDILLVGFTAQKFILLGNQFIRRLGVATEN